MKIRKMRISEELALHQVFYSSIHENAKGYYTQQQLEVWAPENIDKEAWSQKMRKINPYVVLIGHQIVGYGDVGESGYIDHFFVRGGYSRKGVATKIMSKIIEEARDKGIKELTSNVSLAAQGFFKKHGFYIVKVQQVQVRGEILENAKMCKVINSGEEVNEMQMHY